MSGFKNVKTYSQIGGSICTEFHGQPIKCNAHSEDDIHCVYTAGKVKGEVGQCKKSSSRDIEKSRKSARTRDTLEKQFEDDAGNRLLNAWNKKKLNMRRAARAQAALAPPALAPPALAPPAQAPPAQAPPAQAPPAYTIPPWLTAAVARARARASATLAQSASAQWWYRRGLSVPESPQTPPSQAAAGFSLYAWLLERGLEGKYSAIRSEKNAGQMNEMSREELLDFFKKHGIPSPMDDELVGIIISGKAERGREREREIERERETRAAHLAELLIEARRRRHIWEALEEEELAAGLGSDLVVSQREVSGAELRSTDADSDHSLALAAAEVAHAEADVTAEALEAANTLGEEATTMGLALEQLEEKARLADVKAEARAAAEAEAATIAAQAEEDLQVAMAARHVLYVAEENLRHAQEQAEMALNKAVQAAAEMSESSGQEMDQGFLELEEEIRLYEEAEAEAARIRMLDAAISTQASAYIEHDEQEPECFNDSNCSSNQFCSRFQVGEGEERALTGVCIKKSTAAERSRGRDFDFAFLRDEDEESFVDREDNSDLDWNAFAPHTPRTPPPPPPPSPSIFAGMKELELEPEPEPQSGPPKRQRRFFHPIEGLDEEDEEDEVYFVHAPEEEVRQRSRIGEPLRPMQPMPERHGRLGRPSVLDSP